ncbi:MAG: hypothetical protein OEU48_09730 [Gammaproteobacteria bacterium]|nr:hypothetical protein [Gammaproteobacteria bacterium]
MASHEMEMEPLPPSDRYTPDGDAAVEARIDCDQQLIAAAIKDAVPTAHFRALVLIGGYARGEGGFCHVDGKPAPYNDYDYFVVVGGMNHAAIQTLKSTLLDLGHLLTARVGVEVDLAVLKEEALPGAEYSLMHAEMLWGHKVVAGDAAILDAMPPMPFAGLGLAEFTRLMLNRGSLLLMNRDALARGNCNEPQQREQFMKYLFKAILACGDAQLAAIGQYHPSYSVKWQRLQNLQWYGNEGFMPQYEMALDAKFYPAYEQYDTAKLAQCLQQVTDLWLLTLACLESVRLGTHAGSWDEYASPAVCKGQSAPGLRGLVRNVGVTVRDYGVRELLTNLRWSLRYPRERLISALPGLLGEPGMVHDSQLTTALGLTAVTGRQEMTRSYLQQWHRYA